MYRGARLRIGEAGLIFGAAVQFRGFAEGHVPREAVLAVAAEGREAGDDVIPGLHVGHHVPHRLHHAGGFVPENGGQRVGVGAIGEVQIGVAHAGSGGAHEHLPGAGLGHLHILNDERFVRFVQNGCFHACSLPSLTQDLTFPSVPEPYGLAH